MYECIRDPEEDDEPTPESDPMVIMARLDEWWKIEESLKANKEGAE
jgi:hypothetical protein